MEITPSPRDRKIARRADMHLETVRYRLTRLRDAGGDLTIDEIITLCRGTFAEGCHAMADAINAEMSANHLAEIEKQHAAGNVVLFPVSAN